MDSVYHQSSILRKKVLDLTHPLDGDKIDLLNVLAAGLTVSGLFHASFFHSGSFLLLPIP